MRKAKAAFRQQSRETNQRPQDLINTVLRDQTNEVIANMPSIRSIARSVRKYRAGTSNSQNFRTVADIVLPDELLQMGNESILFFDSGSEDRERFLIFSNAELQSIAKNGKNFNLDGTFKVAPKIFYQLYTVQCWFRETLIPVFYILLTGKNQNLYERVFQKIAHLIETPRVELNLMIDLELGAYNAIQSVFPESKLIACSFHFRQVFIYIF